MFRIAWRAVYVRCRRARAASNGAAMLMRGVRTISLSCTP